MPQVFWKTCAALGVVEVRYSLSEGDNDRTRCLWEEASRRGITMQEFWAGENNHGVFIARFKGESICFEGVPRSGRPSRSFAWMDNKELMRKSFSKFSIPIAEGGVCRSWQEAKTLFEQRHKPLIVKPHFGSRSRHTTTHITSLEQFKTAFEKAKQLSPWVIVEEELTGSVYRGTVIAGKLVAVMRRDPPFVTGEGVSTVEQLLERENTRTERQGPNFHQIPKDADLFEELRRQGVELLNIIPKGKIITLGQKVGRSNGGSTTDVTEEIHADNQALLEKVAAVLDDSVVGIDFIMDDIGISWRQQKRAGVIECNSLPFIDLHHFPLNGKPRNVAAFVWDSVFPSSRI